MKTIAPTPVLLFLAALSVGACRTASRQSEVTPLASQRSLALLLTFVPTHGEPSAEATGAAHACPIKVANPSDGSQFLLRRSIQRDSVAQRDGGFVTYPYALGDYEPSRRARSRVQHTSGCVSTVRPSAASHSCPGAPNKRLKLTARGGY